MMDFSKACRLTTTSRALKLSTLIDTSRNLSINARVKVKFILNLYVFFLSETESKHKEKYHLSSTKHCFLLYNISEIKAIGQNLFVSGPF